MVLRAKGFIFYRAPRGMLASVSYRARNVINEQNNQISYCPVHGAEATAETGSQTGGEPSLLTGTVWCCRRGWRFTLFTLEMCRIYSKPKHLFTVLCFGNINSPGMFYTGGCIFGRKNESSHFDRYHSKWLCPSNIYNEQNPSSDQ